MPVQINGSGPVSGVTDLTNPSGISIPAQSGQLLVGDNPATANPIAFYQVNGPNAVRIINGSSANGVVPTSVAIAGSNGQYQYQGNSRGFTGCFVARDSPNGGLSCYGQSRGTIDAPSATQSGDEIFGFRFTGAGATDGVAGQCAQIRVFANADFTDTSKPGQIDFATASTNSTNVTSRVTIDQNGLNLASGCPGINFQAAAGNSGTSDSNLLDDYEEGTWTPDVDGFGTGLCSYARYTKIGNQVTCTFGWLNDTIPAYGPRDTASYVAVDDFPFAIVNQATGRSAGSVATLNSFTFSGAAQIAMFGTNSAGMFVMNGDTTWQNNSSLDPGNGRYLHATITYFTA